MSNFDRFATLAIIHLVLKQYGPMCFSIFHHLAAVLKSSAPRKPSKTTMSKSRPFAQSLLPAVPKLPSITSEVSVTRWAKAQPRGRRSRSETLQLRRGFWRSSEPLMLKLEVFDAEFEANNKLWITMDQNMDSIILHIIQYNTYITYVRLEYIRICSNWITHLRLIKQLNKASPP